MIRQITDFICCTLAFIGTVYLQRLLDAGLTFSGLWAPVFVQPLVWPNTVAHY